MKATYVLWRIVWYPRDEGDLAALALATHGIVFDIENSVPAAYTLLAALVLALGAQQLLPELGVVRVGGTLLDDNLLPIIGDLEDDPFGGLAELEFVEGLDALGRDGDSGWGSGSVGVIDGFACVVTICA